jgi:lipopolysaccharide assembly outer membrane protein LptD (OstA)
VRGSLLKILLVLIPFSFCLSQTDDSLRLTPLDTLKKLAEDTTRPASDLDAIVEYTAKDSAVFDITSQKLLLYNDAELKYKEFDLKAARIILFRENATLESFGIPDTSDEGKFMGMPVFFEGAKKYEGEKVRYNFKTRKGNITMGSTEIEGGYYIGETIKKVADNVYFVRNGRYTTCNKEDPDFYFGSPRMKIIQGDKVVAEPVYLYVDDVPIFAIPFGVFPNHSGRSSGLIPPAYGEDATYGRYLSHLGYFWAINDYTDLTFQGNYFTGGRLDLSGRFRYALRYRFNGALDLGGSRIRIGEQTDVERDFHDDWRIGLVHSQTINPTTSIAADVNFLSSKNYYNNSTNNLNDLLLQHAMSNVTVSKYWEETPNSMTLNYFRDQNLQTGEVDERIPSVNFTRSQSYPFRGKNTSALDLKWYETISYDYSAQFANNHNKMLLKDTSGAERFDNQYRGGLRQTVNITPSVKVSEFTLTPFFNYVETWYNRYIGKRFNPSDSSVIVDELRGFRAFRYFSTGISANTRVIGILNTDMLGVKGFRHTVVPAVIYSFRPDFSKSNWNIYGSYKDAAGKDVLYTFYEREVFGSAPAGEFQNLSFSVSNVFEMKTRATDTTDNKFQILNLNALVGYNFAADSMRLSDLSLTYRTQVASILDIGGSATFNFYKYQNNVGRINKFLWSTDKKIADLTSFNINIQTTIQGGEIPGTETDTTKKQKSEDEYIGIYTEKPVDFSIPWSISLNYNYGINQFNPQVKTKLSNLSGNLSFSLTKNWKFTFSTGYDMFNKEFTAPYVTIYRDLHCWEMNFNWIPTGSYRGFRFELRVKAPQLQDVKVTKQTNYRGVYR